MHDCGRQAAVWGQAVNPEVFSQPVLRCQPESRRDGVFALEGAELCNTGDRGRIDVRVLTVASASRLSSMVLTPKTSPGRSTRCLVFAMNNSTSPSSSTQNALLGHPSRMSVLPASTLTSSRCAARRASCCCDRHWNNGS